MTGGVVGVEFGAPKAAGLSLGSPSFSISILRIKGLAKEIEVQDV